MLKTAPSTRQKLLAATLAFLGSSGLVRLATVTVSAQSGTPTAPQKAEPHIPSDPVHQSAYDLRFGANPYLPSEAKADFSGFLDPAQIPSASYCGHCHSGVHAQWRQSAHANSFRAPWYIKNVNELGETRGIAYTRHCEGCHNPSALFTGALTPGSKVARPNDEDGVTCMVCHSIRQVQSTKGIGSYVMGTPAVMLDDAGQPVKGTPSDAEILAHLDRHKQAVMRPFYKTSEYCSVCHKAAMPRMLNGYKWLRTFSTYDEWQQSSWSTETPLSFYKKPKAVSCQGCHMERELTVAATAPDGTVASHRWLGANTAVPAQYGFDEQAKRIVDFLRNNQLQVDIFGVTIEHSPTLEPASFVPGQLIAPLGTKAFNLIPGDWVRVDVFVRNKGIGHTLVPELRDFYESWLDFEAVDDSGKVIYRSGAVDEKTHAVDREARAYTTRILSNDGKGLDHHEVWKIYVKAFDATVSPGKSDVVRYRFQIPRDSKGFHVTASVRYRRFRREFTNWVFNDAPTAPDRFPTVTLAAGAFHFNAGLNNPLPKNAFPEDQNELLRWNNYGIGMLDRQQMAEAVDAFTHVVNVDHTYEPGYVNVAIAEYSRGRYPEALIWIDRALQMDPTDARAQYYKGLCLRWQTHYDEAIAVLEPVAKRYPRFRQVHQELGYIYMIQKRYQDSRTEYETVLRIDPDDALAHRWLGPVLAALGDSKGAAAEAALAWQTNPDTAAGWVAQRYWRENLTIAHESMPSHTYSAGDLMDDADVRRVLNLQNPPSYIWVDHF